jgi:hypothetical protein
MGGLVAQGLGDMAVLAEIAAEIAPHRRHREGRGPGQEMEEGLFLDGIGRQGDAFPIDQRDQAALVVAARAAYPHLAGRDLAPVMAQVATDVRAAFDSVVEIGFVFHGPLSLSEFRVSVSCEERQPCKERELEQG